MEEKLKIAVISGASHALSYKARNPRATDQEVLKEVTQKAETILRNMDSEENN